MIDRSDMVQVRAAFGVGMMPPAPDREDRASAWATRKAAAEHLSARYGAAARFESPPFDTDPESERALAAYHDGVPLIIHGQAVDFAAEIPLLVGHVPIPLPVDLDVGTRGDQFTLTGWVPSKWAELLARQPYCSPGLQLRRARIVEIAPATRRAPATRMIEATDVLLIELSATDSPRLAGTSFAVGPVAGRRYWPDPSFADAERFTAQQEGLARIAFAGMVEVS